jgi:hypothetical protein
MCRTYIIQILYYKEYGSSSIDINNKVILWGAVIQDGEKATELSKKKETTLGGKQ